MDTVEIFNMYASYKGIKMYIDTHSYDTMLQGTCDCFTIPPSNLSEFFSLTAHKCIQDKCCNGNILAAEIDTFIQQHTTNQYIDEILFFHLGRRLNIKDTLTGNNLLELLTTVTPLSIFLREHNVAFSQRNGHLEIYENGILVSLENTYENGVCYLRSRLGYNIGREDFCFNGFAFKDLVYKNTYAHSLYHGPEFITQLSAFLKRPDIAQDYFANSTYYCFEYCAPLEFVLFDNADKLNQDEKVHYFLTQLINRLFEYFNTNPKYMFDHDNLVLRLLDNANMPIEYYCGREIITTEMLR
ncbi:hypothetical protein [Anaeromicropila herbilytica]|nr:hypothetical protein [Anaeromicropila herbilytica]